MHCRGRFRFKTASLVMLMTIMAWPIRGAIAAELLASPPSEIKVTVYRDPYRQGGNINLNNLNGFALISETRTLTVPQGESRVRFSGVADGIQAVSAILTGLKGVVIEKN